MDPRKIEYRFGGQKVSFVKPRDPVSRPSDKTVFSLKDILLSILMKSNCSCEIMKLELRVVHRPSARVKARTARFSLPQLRLPDRASSSRRAVPGPIFLKSDTEAMSRAEIVVDQFSSGCLVRTSSQGSKSSMWNNRTPV